MPSIKRNIRTIILVLLIGLIIQVLFDPLGSIEHSGQVVKARILSTSARAKWDAQKIADYSFEIRGYAPLACIVSALIEVRNGVVVQVELMDFVPGDSPTSFLPPEEWANSSYFSDQIFLCDHANFTIPQIFDLLEELLEMEAASILRVDFDPKYGFTTYFRFGSFVPNGLLSPRIGDCCSEFRIENFQVLEE